MDQQHWPEVESLLYRALRLEHSQRREFLEHIADGSVRAEVESLLNADDAAGPGQSQFKALIGSSFLNPETELSSAALPNEAIGPYRLLQIIGRGGMGEIWLAEQKSPVRRRVALKLIKVGMDTQEVLSRFQSELQALALMDHPAIAKVFEAGKTPEGRPYFVMEYVPGLAITDYCDKHRLTIQERLSLFCSVCEGVQHAHQKAVIHRDLKPSNILVTEVDGKAAPKIIDFGVAKALAQKLTADTIFTRVGAIIGTPEYMSPEQALSSGEDIDTRTDVYSLGIILYELVAGVPPIDLRKIAFDEFLRRLREEEPLPPSTSIRTHDPVTSSELASNRQTELRALAKQIRGDLDSIALKALEKERSRRYGSPSDLASDIGRYLRNEPVLAVSPSAAYHARKFARRYRGPLVTTAAFVLLLLLATAISIRQSIRANREAAVAQAVTDFLESDMLAQASANSQAGPTTKPDPDLKVRTALDRAAARIRGRFDRQPEVEAAIRDTIGQTYRDLGLYPEARRQFKRALELHRRVAGTENPATMKTMSRLGYIAWLEGKYPEAENLYRQTLEVQRRVLGPEHADTLYSMQGLARAEYSQGKYAEAEALERQTLEICRRVLGPEHASTMIAMNVLATIYSEEGKHAEAEAIIAQVVEIQRRLLGPEHPNTLIAMNNLAVACGLQGKYAEAEALASEALNIQRRVLGPQHPEMLVSINNLAGIYLNEGKYAQAAKVASEALNIQRRVLGPQHPDTLNSMDNLASAYALQGKYGQAESLLSQTLESSRRVLGPDHPFTLGFLSDFASLYQVRGKYILAETHAAQVLAGRRHAFGSENADTMASAADLALALISQEKFVQSEPLAREAANFGRSKQPEHWQHFRAECLLRASLAGQKKYADAEPLLLGGYRGMLARKDGIPVPDRYHLDRAREWIVQLYERWGKPAQVAEWRRK